MADLNGDFSFLAASARRFVDLLADPTTPRPGDDERGSALAQHIDQATDGVRGRISDVAGQFAVAKDDHDRLECIKQMRLLAGYAHFMQRALPWLEDATDPPLELGALCLIDEAALAIVGDRVDPVPTRSDEYSTEMWPFEPLFPALNLKVGGGPLPIILNFPALEAASCLLLPIFGHELGHTAVAKHDLVSGSLAPLREDVAYRGRVTAAQESLVSSQGISRPRARLIINQRLEHWVEELLCDQLGLQHFGPSFFLAIASYLIALSWDEPGPRHPPTTVRIAHLLQWIDESGWGAVLDKRAPALLAWLREVAREPRRPNLAPVIAFLLDSVEDARPHIEAVVGNLLGEHVYKAAEYEPVAGVLRELLDYDILPVQHPETAEPFDSRAILLAGWFSIYGELGGDSAENLCRSLVHGEGHEFFTKALEMRAVLAGWRQL